MTAPIPTPMSPTQGAREPKARRLALARWLRLAAALVPLVWLARRVPLSEVGARISEVGVLPLALAFAALLGSLLCATVRWRTLLAAYGANPLQPFVVLLRHNLVAAYFNVLPSGLWGDAVRGYRVRAALDNLTASYTVVVVERVAGLLGLVILGAALTLVGGGAAPVGIRIVTWTMALAVPLCIGVLGMPALLASMPALRARVERLPLVGRILIRVAPPRSALGIVVAVLLSLFTQGLVALAIAVIVRALAPEVSMLALGCTLPVAILLMYLPLTPGAIGQREAVFVYLLSTIGVPAATALASSLLYFVLSLGIAATGGLCLLGERLAVQRRE